MKKKERLKGKTFGEIKAGDSVYMVNPKNGKQVLELTVHSVSQKAGIPSDQIILLIPKQKRVEDKEICFLSEHFHKYQVPKNEDFAFFMNTYLPNVMFTELGKIKAWMEELIQDEEKIVKTKA